MKFFVKRISSELSDIYNILPENNLIKELVNRTLHLLELSFFDDISDVPVFPFNSQILQKKYPYNVIFRCYNYLQLIPYISNNILDESIDVGQKDIPKLYEYWTFFQVYNIVNSLYKEIKCDWCNFNTYKLNVTLKEGSSSLFMIDDEYELELYYNKEYKGTKILDNNIGVSYSLNYRPDISLILYKNKEIKTILLFDAKYKLTEGDTEDNNPDLSKMHAYKDAIIGVSGAYVLCVKKSNNSYYYKNKFEYDNKFNSIGTISMIPGEYSDNDIRNLIEKFVNLGKGMV